MAIIEQSGEARFVGAVLGRGEHNYGSDSYFYALVWDAERQAVREVEYAATAYAGGARLTIDATAEATKAAQDWLACQLWARWEREAEAEARTVETGKRVVVARGRKVPVGTVGTVTHMTRDRYRPDEWRVGVVDSAGYRHWTAASNCDVLDWSEYLPSWEQAGEIVSDLVEARQWSAAWSPRPVVEQWGGLRRLRRSVA